MTVEHTWWVLVAALALSGCGDTSTPSSEVDVPAPDMNVPPVDVGGDDATTADTAGDSTADIGTDSGDAEDIAPPPRGTCLTEYQWFQVAIWNKFMGSKCAGCHMHTVSGRLVATLISSPSVRTVT